MAGEAARIPPKRSDWRVPWHLLGRGFRPRQGNFWTIRHKAERNSSTESHDSIKNRCSALQKLDSNIAQLTRRTTSIWLSASRFLLFIRVEGYP